MMDNVRILEGWTKEEREALKSLNSFIYPELGITKLFTYANTELKPLVDKINNESGMKVLTDVVDFVNDKAKFSEQKYYVKLPITDFPYLTKLENGETNLVKSTYEGSETKSFTKDEIEKIDLRLLAFAVPVEKDDE